MSEWTDKRDHVALILCAHAKRLLPEPGDQALRLHVLKLMGRFFPDEMLQLIAPAGDTELRMIRAARKFDSSEPLRDGALQPSFDVLGDSFEHFVKLNPGLQKALDWRAAQKAERDRQHEAWTAQSLADARQGHTPVPNARNMKDDPDWVRGFKTKGARP